MIEVLARLEIQDVQAPEEVVEPPDSGPARDNLSGVWRDIEAGSFAVFELDPPKRTFSAGLGAGVVQTSGGAGPGLAAIERRRQSAGFVRLQRREGSARASLQNDRRACGKRQHPGLTAGGRLQFGSRRCQPALGDDLIKRPHTGQVQRLGRCGPDPVLAADGLDRNSGHDQTAADPEQDLQSYQERDPFVKLGGKTQQFHSVGTAKAVVVQVSPSKIDSPFGDAVSGRRRASL